MMTIQAVKTKDARGTESIAPAQQFPADAIAIVCDGDVYLVYQAGDELPEQPQ